MTIGERRPTTGLGLVIRTEDSEVDQAAVVEIRTRAVHKVLDTDIVLPRFWISQTPNLIVAYHKGGRFNDVQILDVRKDIEVWEEQNPKDLRNLDTVRNTITMKWRVRRSDSGKLEIWELDIGHQNALPDDLCFKLREEKGLEDGNDGWKRMGQGSLRGIFATTTT